MNSKNYNKIIILVWSRHYVAKEGKKSYHFLEKKKKNLEVRTIDKEIYPFQDIKKNRD